MSDYYGLHFRKRFHNSSQGKSDSQAEVLVTLLSAESLRLEKTSKTIQSRRQPSTTTVPAKPRPAVPPPPAFRTPPRTVTPPPPRGSPSPSLATLSVKTFFLTSNLPRSPPTYPEATNGCGAWAVPYPPHSRAG